MKFKKTIAALVVAATLASAGALAACNDEGGTTVIPDGPGGGSNSGGLTTYTIEAELINLDDVIGGGISSNQSGTEMIYGDGTQEQKDQGWSNGYFVGYTYSSECVMEFVFESDKETTGSIVARLGTELSSVMMMSPQDVEFKINGTVLQYGNLSITGVPQDLDKMTFKDYTIGNNVKIVKGENKLVMSIKQNNLNGNSTGGPTIDCIKITTDAKITYVEHTDNLTGGGI